MSETVALIEETGLIQQFGFNAMFRDVPSPHPERTLLLVGLHVLADHVIYNSGNEVKFWVVRRCAIQNDLSQLTRAFADKGVPIYH